VYVASADWKTRNLDRRLELMWPVEGAAHKARVIGALRAMFRDTVKSWRLLPDGSYQRQAPADGEPPFRVQQFLQDEARRAASLARDAAGITFVPERK
jgi:polyphosphate kinase